MITVTGNKKKHIELGAKLILKGEIVAFPTETVYGLGAHAFDASAIKKIYDAKGRPFDNPLIVHLFDLASLSKVAKEIPEIAKTLYKAFCPGPLTMILNKSPDLPYSATGGLETVGVRFPAHPIARELIRLSAPIAAPSANLSKHISPTAAKHVFEDLAGRIPLIIDGGDSEMGIESTIVDLSREKYIILRPGIITKEDLNKYGDFYDNEDFSKARSPGMKYTHYSPNCDCVVGDLEKIIKIYDENTALSVSSIILARKSTISKLGGRNAWSLGNTAKDAAKRFYSLLREGEKKYSLIIIEDLGCSGIFNSIMNRAQKAAKQI